jgi:hypothetical protein
LKKILPYILGSVLLVAVLVLFFTGNNNQKKKLNERITLRRQDKIPYGTYVAYRNLKYIFPAASIHINKDEPGYWDSLSIHDSKQALIIICGQFNAGEEEMKKMISFAENGNDVFVSAGNISYDAEQMITGSETKTDLTHYYGNSSKDNMTDSLNLSLLDPPFQGGYAEYEYPGKRFCSHFSQVNNTTTDIIGNDEGGVPYFIRLRAGKGNFYIHLAPLAFSNYFILHKNNIEYYEKAFSLIRPDVTKVVWDEYYLNKRYSGNNGEKKKSWLAVLFRYPAFKAALLTAIFTLLLNVLLGMRRKQRYIPVITKPRNDSLDFVKTIGRLYYDKGDHKNLCRKMGAYFLEHVRNKYKLPTGSLDDDFVKNLQYKSGAEESEIRGIVSFIKYLDEAEAINNNQLTDFHKQLESFYKKA